MVQYELNEDMSKYNAKVIQKITTLDSKILALGIAFKGEPHTDDTRDSVGLKMIDYLKQDGLDIFVHDISVSEKKILDHGHKYTNLEDLGEFNTILFLNNDIRYTDLIKRLAINKKLNKNFIIYDPWKIF